MSVLVAYCSILYKVMLMEVTMADIVYTRSVSCVWNRKLWLE